ncbi:MAG: hypothetical protein R3Y64_11265 [Peptostreptococcaceae bacterium]
MNLAALAMLILAIAKLLSVIFGFILEIKGKTFSERIISTYHENFSEEALEEISKQAIEISSRKTRNRL